MLGAIIKLLTHNYSSVAGIPDNTTMPLGANHGCSLLIPNIYPSNWHSVGVGVLPSSLHIHMYSLTSIEKSVGDFRSLAFAAKEDERLA